MSFAAFLWTTDMVLKFGKILNTRVEVILISECLFWRQLSNCDEHTEDKCHRREQTNDVDGLVTFSGELHFVFETSLVRVFSVPSK